VAFAVGGRDEGSAEPGREQSVTRLLIGRPFEIANIESVLGGIGTRDLQKDEVATIGQERRHQMPYFAANRRDRCRRGLAVCAAAHQRSERVANQDDAVPIP
jgi:hypothetical protein